MDMSTRMRWARGGAVMVLVAMAGVAGVATPAHAVPGLVFKTTTSPTDSTPGKIQSANCPAGTRILGGGAFVNGGDRRVIVETMRPVTTEKGDSFEAVASEFALPDEPYEGEWSLVAYAVCGSAPDGLEYVSATSPSGVGVLSATATCPPGRVVIGAGGQVTPNHGRVALDEITPSMTTVRVTGFETEIPPTPPWGVNAYAVCAKPIPGLTIVSGTSPEDSLDKSVDVTCPTGTRVHGIGGDLKAAYGQGFIVALFPGQPLTTAHLRAREDPTGISGTWLARVFAICAA